MSKKRAKKKTKRIDGSFDADKAKKGADRDTFGAKIPRESERREGGEDLPSRDKKKPVEKKRYRIYEAEGEKRILRINTKAVIAAIVAVAVAAVAIMMLVMNQEKPASQADDESIISMIGITPDGERIIDDLGKFDSMLFVDGIPAGKLYDSLVTADEQAVLAARGQQRADDGTFAYNPEVSTKKAKIEEREKQERLDKIPKDKSVVEQ